jgi:nucleoid-associated protein YgaU
MIGRVKKGALVAVATQDRVTFTFNPSTMAITKTSSWRAQPAARNEAAPPAQFVGTDAQTIDLTVLFDGWAAPGDSVTDSVQQLVDWTKPTKDSLTTDAPQPPLVQLDFGGAVAQPTCYLRSVTATYLLFDDGGEPTRATVALSLTEVHEVVKRQNPTSGSEPGTRHRATVGGDSLASLAWQEYGDPALWRALALANGVDDPMRLASGTSLLVPPQATARRLAALPEVGRGA